MNQRPERKPRESMLAWYERVNQWEREYRPIAAKEARVIDRLNKRGSITTQTAVTAQAALDRLSIHDRIQASSSSSGLLRNIARRMQQ